MKDGNCPKCGKMDVRQVPFAMSPRNFLPLSFFEFWPARIDNYVCTSCGYLESYVRENALAKFARVARPVPDAVA